MPLLLDTHALVWLAADLGQLPERVKTALRAERAALHVSAISALEIAILVKRKRLVLPVEPARFVERAVAQHGLLEVAVDREIALASAALPDLHNDPFDRILVATALRRRMVLVTRDQAIGAYPGVETLWG